MNKVKPYTQGNFDGLCGLYSLINAYKLVHHKNGIKAYRFEVLFFKALLLIGSEQVLETLRHGIHINLLLVINKQVFRKKYPTICIKRPFLKKKADIHEKMKLISKVLENKGVVIIGYQGKYVNHWTVICDENSHSYILADSSYMQFLRKSSFLGEKPFYFLEEVLPLVWVVSS